MDRMTIDTLSQRLDDFQKFIELKLENIISKQKEIHNQVSVTNGRVTKLEKIIWFVMGIVSTVSTFWTVFTFIAQ